MILSNIEAMLSNLIIDWIIYEEEIETRNDIIIDDNKFVDKYEIDDLVILFKELKIFC